MRKNAHWIWLLKMNNGNVSQPLGRSPKLVSTVNFKEFNQPILARKPELIYGLRNIVQNAIEFSKNKVWIDVTYNIKSLNILISDDGSGYPSNLLKKIGEPFLNESNLSIFNRPDLSPVGGGKDVKRVSNKHTLEIEYVSCKFVKNSSQSLIFWNVVI